MPLTTDDEIDAVLDLETIAVVGCSTTPGKAAHDVPAYLQQHGYSIVPVNPFADEILGKQAYESITDIEKSIDIVNVFRPSDEVAGIVDSVVDRYADRGDASVVWLQLGIHDDEAVSRAERAGLDVVEDKCMKIEHDRLQ
ncbi:CoA-binding protein [Halalkalirubrum salinum]|uniref:CoA-binding protein n=1 Tax=Halalkalirubrum salinum TaxID=2563889 RepID=UPI0010FB613A|nr:CoA-binding protein [Halalkalirubrum salinum]